MSTSRSDAPRWRRRPKHVAPDPAQPVAGPQTTGGDHPQPAPPGAGQTGAADAVGYGRPPRQHQFKPGHSGNPRGRPKGATSEAAMLTALLARPVTIHEGGRSRRITLREAIYHRVVQDALKGNLKAVAFLLSREAAIEQGAAGAAEMSADDRTVLEAYLQNLLGASPGGGDDGV
ncbi:MAG TPA: DUF5681 domain-containing protein [Xanthobacteraceae bacterium]|nr:DUF5681 domain-containing protein [Xanthobacteraceae bacterium]